MTADDPRRLPRFSLRSLILLVAMAGSGYGLWARREPWAPFRTFHDPNGIQGSFVDGGSKLMTTDLDKGEIVTLWDIETRKKLGQFHQKMIHVDPSDRYFSGNDLDRAREEQVGRKRDIIDVRTGKVVRTFPSGVYELDAEAQEALIRDKNGDVVLLNFVTGEERWRKSDVEGKPTSAGFHSGSNRVWVILDDGSCRVWDVQRDTLIATLRHKGARIAYIQFSRDGTRALAHHRTESPSAPKDMSGLWDLIDSRLIKDIAGYAYFRHPGDRILLIAGPDTSGDARDRSPVFSITIGIYDKVRGRQIRLQENMDLRSVRLSQEGAVLAGIVRTKWRTRFEVEHEVRLWSINSGRLVGRHGPFLKVEAAFSTSGKHLAIWADDMLYIVDTETGREIRRRPFKSEASVIGLRFLADERRLLVSSTDEGEQIHIFDLPTLDLLDIISGPLHDSTLTSDRILGSDNEGDALVIWRRRRPEALWGVAWLPAFWLTLAAGIGLLWSLRRDRRLRDSQNAEIR